MQHKKLKFLRNFILKTLLVYKLYREQKKKTLLVLLSNTQHFGSKTSNYSLEFTRIIDFKKSIQELTTDRQALLNDGSFFTDIK